MKKTFWERISDITHLHRRAAFSDLPNPDVTTSAFLELARNRYSCRSFKDTPLTDEQIANILEAARSASPPPTPAPSISSGSPSESLPQRYNLLRHSSADPEPVEG